MSQTNLLTNKILDFLNNNNACAFRINTTGTFDPTMKRFRKIRECNKGVSDIICCYQGKIYCIELKQKYEKQRPHQIVFEKRINDSGGCYKVIKNWEEFEIFWDNIIIII